MNIGISTSVQTGKENWDRILDLINLEFKHIELHNKLTRVRMSDVKPLLKLKKREKLNYSFHSLVQDLFCDDDIVTEGEFKSLIGEIRLASMIGCLNLNFHISKKIKLNSQDEKKLNEIITFAKKNEINLCLENNSSRSPFSGDYLIEVMNKFPGINFCLDIGHLNIAINKGLISDKKQFLNQIKDRIIELHINYNNGQNDEHRELNNSAKTYLDSIFNLIDKDKVLIVIETKNIKQGLKTKLYLEKYA